MGPAGIVRNNFEVVGLPMSYLIGRNDKISGRVLGNKEWDSPDAYGFIEGLLEPG